MPEETQNNGIEDISAQLASEQEYNLAAQQFNQTVEEAKQYDHPSYLKYGFLFAVAGIIDIVDVADVTGIGIIISKIVSIVGTVIIHLVLFLSNGKAKRAHQYGENLEASVAAFGAQTARIDQAVLRGAKTLGKITGMKGLSRRARLARIKIKKFARKNPLTKALIGGALNLVPFLAIINLMIFWVYMSYRDEKNAYQQAREAALEAAQQFEQTQTA